MLRRDFLKAGIGGAASFALLQPRAFAAGNDAPLRVGLIGCGWYGKTDLLHLIQVAPVEVVGLCDVDSRHARPRRPTLSRSGSRPKSSRQPSATIANCSPNEKPEIVLIATPDHWHCLPMVEACKSGADVYVQKPISYDVVEGQAMVAAARKYNRTVQVGLQRRSTPHLLEARDKIIRERQARQNRPRRNPQLLRPAARLSGRHRAAASISIGKCTSARPRGASTTPAFIRVAGATAASSATARRATCASTSSISCATSLDLGWPRRSRLPAASSCATRIPTSTRTTRKPPSSTTATCKSFGTNATGDRTPTQNIPWGATLYGDKGMLKMSVQSYDFIPHGGGTPVHGDFVDEREKYPEDLRTQRNRALRRAGHAAPLRKLPRRPPRQEATGRRHRRGPHFLGLLHPGQPLDGPWPQPEVGRDRRPGHRR